MKVVFAGLDHPIEVASGHVSVLTILNNALFCRLCQSLLSQEGEDAVEPYTVWDEEGEPVKPSDAFIVVRDPFNLPFDDKRLMGQLHERIKQELLVDEEARLRIKELSATVATIFSEICMQFNADYGFALEWDECRYLKAFGFGLELREDASLLDNLIRLIDLAADAKIDETILFVNIRTFLSKRDAIELNERVFFHGMKVLMLENRDLAIYDDIERKVVVDQHFVEYVISHQPECPSSSQGRFCSNGFGAVTF